MTTHRAPKPAASPAQPVERAVTAALVASVVLTIAVPALVLRFLARGDAGSAKVPDEQ